MDALAWLDRFRGFLGIAAILGLAVALCEDRRAISRRVVFWGLALQWGFALLVLRVPLGERVLRAAGGLVESVLGQAMVGARFVFSPKLVDDTTSEGFLFAFRVLPTVIFVAALFAVLYHLGVMQGIVRGFAWIMARLMGASGAESLNVAASLFLGQTEAPLTIRPYLPKLSRSELLTVMTSGMAHVSGGIMAAYFAQGVSPQHILTAVIMTAPGTILLSKLLVPETTTPETLGLVRESAEKPDANLLDAASRGTREGLSLALNIAAMLVSFLALIALVNAGLGWIGSTIVGFWPGDRAAIWLGPLRLSREALRGLSLQGIFRRGPRAFGLAAGGAVARLPGRSAACSGRARSSISSVVPSQVIARTENRRLGVEQPAPYARVPASAESVNDRIVYGDLPDDVDVYDTDGDFFFVTVSAPNQSVLSWLVGREEPVVEPLTEEGRNGRLTSNQNREISLQQMRTATQEAEFVALTAAGYDTDIQPGAVVVQDVLCAVVAADQFTCEEEFPAAEVLEPADTILSIDGAPVTSIEDLAAALEGRQPGDDVDLTIERPQVGQLDVQVELAADPTDPSRTIIGFQPFDTRTVDLPFDVSIDTEAVGGPSAGTAFTLALIDELTEGDLAGGRNIAVTGTISLDGTVGPIGGLEQKVSAVHQHGVEVFLVPASQIELQPPDPSAPDDGVCRRACLNAAGDGEVVLIPIATLDDALGVLRLLGGDPIRPADLSPSG